MLIAIGLLLMEVARTMFSGICINNFVLQRVPCIISRILLQMSPLADGYLHVFTVVQGNQVVRLLCHTTALKERKKKDS